MRFNKTSSASSNNYLTIPFRNLHLLCSGSSTFLQRGSPPPPPWRLLPESLSKKFHAFSDVPSTLRGFAFAPLLLPPLPPFSVIRIITTSAATRNTSPRIAQ